MNTFPPRPCSCSLNSSIAKQLAESEDKSPDSYPWPLKILESCALVYNRTEESSPNTMSYSLGTMPRTLTLGPLCLYLHGEGVPHVITESQLPLWVVSVARREVASSHL